MKTPEQLAALASEMVAASRALDLIRMGRALTAYHDLSPLELAAFRIALARAEATL